MAEFEELYDPLTGQAWSRGLLNKWSANSLYLHSLATRYHEVFTGFIISTAFTYYQFERTVWQGYFRYDGILTLHCAAVATSGTLKVYVTDDGGESAELTLTGATNTADIDLTGRTFTQGNIYLVRCTVLWDGATTDIHLDTLAIKTNNDYAWPTLPTWATAVNTAAHLTTVNTAQRFLREIAEVPTGNNSLATFIADGVTYKLFNGGFYMRGKTAAAQVTLKLLYRFSIGTTLTLSTYQVASATLIESFTEASFTIDDAEHTATLTLTAGSYSINTSYRLLLSINTGNEQPTDNYIANVRIGGTVALTTLPSTYALGDTINSTKMNVVGGLVSTSNPNEIRALLRGASTVYGFQWLTPATVGSLQIASAIYLSIGNPTINAAGTATAYTMSSFTRVHILRYLWYLPSASGASGQVAYGTDYTLALPDNSGTGLWNYVDLQSVNTLAYGMTLAISNVAACFEAYN